MKGLKMKDLSQKLKNISSDWMDNNKWPIMMMIGFVYLVAMWIQGDVDLTIEAKSGFTIVMIFFLIFYVHKERIFRHRVWIYFVIQGLIVFDTAVIMEVGFEPVYIGLLPVLVYDSLRSFKDKGYVLLTAFLYYGIFTGLILYLEGVQAIRQYLPVLGLVTFAVWIFNSLYTNQVALSMKSQKMARELETANRKLEAMTLEAERERIARDLHDTLSQGLSALVLQMETLQVYLDKDQVDKSKELVISSTSHARKTLSEARMVLKDLRDHTRPDQDLRPSLKIEIDRFMDYFKGRVEVSMEESIILDSTIVNQLSFVLRESLTNIYRHAKAGEVIIFLGKSDGVLRLRIKDDGIGFQTKAPWAYKGHFGLLGMEERVKSIGGRMKIHSGKRKGTFIDIELELKDGGVSIDKDIIG